MEFTHLMEPIKIGSMKLKNRVVMSPLTTNYAEENTGFVSEKMIEYYGARAAGETGLVIVEGANVRDDGRGSSKQMMIDRDETIDGLSALASKIKDNGSFAVLQIMHHGRQTKSRIINAQPVAPSAIPCPVYKETPKELNKDEIRDLQDCFVSAAKRAEKAGFNGVEFHAAHGYLISGFLSSWSNHRSDEYGGTLENRLRFLTEIIDRTKECVNSDFAILCRLSANEFVDGGLDAEEVVQIVKILEPHRVDCFDLSAGVAPSFINMSPPTGVIEAPYEDVAAFIKKEVSVPVISVARILTPEKADQMIKEKKTDLVALGRALVADPEWTKKAKENKSMEIIPCVGCNVCTGRSNNPEVICFLNPHTGRESKWSPSTGSHSKRISILGNAIEGYHAAIMLRRLGHKVTVFHQSNLPFAGLTGLRARVPIQSNDLNRALNYYQNSLKNLHIECRPIDCFNSEAFDGFINTMVDLTQFERLIEPWHIHIQEQLEVSGHEQLDAIQVLNGRLPLSKNVYIVGGSLLGCEVGNFLADKGFQVKIIEAKRRVPFDVGNTILQVTQASFKKQGVQVIEPTQLTSFNKDAAIIWATSYPNPAKLVYLHPKTGIELGDSYKPDVMADLMAKSTAFAFALNEGSEELYVKSF
jgi:2,4-dienoyl-CoA reductase-like NADH-dependent reductase (Old Yellow Enzyme family)